MTGEPAQILFLTFDYERTEKAQGSGSSSNSLLVAMSNSGKEGVVDFPEEASISSEQPSSRKKAVRKRKATHADGVSTAARDTGSKRQKQEHQSSSAGEGQDADKASASSSCKKSSSSSQSSVNAQTSKPERLHHYRTRKPSAASRR